MEADMLIRGGDRRAVTTRMERSPQIWEALKR